MRYPHFIENSFFKLIIIKSVNDTFKILNEQWMNYSSIKGYIIEMDEKMSIGHPFRGQYNLKYILKINFILLININNLSLYNVVINYYLNDLIFHFYFF